MHILASVSELVCEDECTAHCFGVNTTLMRWAANVKHYYVNMRVLVCLHAQVCVCVCLCMCLLESTHYDNGSLFGCPPLFLPFLRSASINMSVENTTESMPLFITSADLWCVCFKLSTCLPNCCQPPHTRTPLSYYKIVKLAPCSLVSHHVCTGTHTHTQTHTHKHTHIRTQRNLDLFPSVFPFLSASEWLPSTYFGVACCELPLPTTSPCIQRVCLPIVTGILYIKI